MKMRHDADFRGVCDIHGAEAYKKLYLVGILRREAGTEGGSERLWLILASLSDRA